MAENPPPTSPSGGLPGNDSVSTERFLEALLATSSDVIIRTTLDGVITGWNPAAERSYGYTADEVIGHPISRIIPNDRSEELPALMKRLRDGECIERLETVRETKGGERLPIIVSLSPVYDRGGQIIGVTMVGQDVARQRRAERERRDLEQRAHREAAARSDSEALLRAIWEATSEALALSDPDGIIMDVNPAYCTLYGRSCEEVIGRSFALIFPEEERAGAEAQYREVFRNPDPLPAFEAHIQRPDGTERVVESRADFLVRGGERVAMVSAIRDITERKRLEQSQNDFVAMASHDLSSPLTVLRARAQLLQRRQRYDEESVTAILEQTKRMGRLINDLRELVQVESRALSLEYELLDLTEVVHDAMNRARALTTAHRMQLVEPGAPMMIAGDRDRLGQVFDNLLGNAIKYSQVDGDIVVRVARVGREAQVSIADQGPGIPSETLPSLFERFVRGARTTGDAGLGLGLYITRMLVEAHNGRVWATSHLGHGSTFAVALPLVSSCPTPDSPNHHGPDPAAR